MNLWTTADPHFGHKNIQRYEDRPDGWEQLIIDRWNERVQEDDLVIVLGDFSFYGVYKTQQIMQELKGRKAIVLGNHDPSAAKLEALGFEAVYGSRGSRKQYIEIPAPYIVWKAENGQKVLLSHYPLYREKLPKREQRMLNYHGHVHSNPYESRDYHRNVSVDVTDFYPVRLSGE